MRTPIWQACVSKEHSEWETDWWWQD
uniref:Uncharacterized protein n=1 Tax=Arundo donax TaxID=35708 RepID=A0A0A8ZM79_ARUDO